MRSARTTTLTLTVSDEDGDGIIVCSDDSTLAYGSGMTVSAAIQSWAEDFDDRRATIALLRGQGPLPPSWIKESAAYAFLEAAVRD